MACCAATTSGSLLRPAVVRPSTQGLLLVSLVNPHVAVTGLGLQVAGWSAVGPSRTPPVLVLALANLLSEVVSRAKFEMRIFGRFDENECRVTLIRTID